MAISISISITQNSQSVSNNTSNVTCSVIAKWTYGSYNMLQKSGYLIIDGTKYSFTSSFNSGQSTSGSQTLFTKTVDVSHASNGTKTLSCSASYTSGVSSGTVTASASKVLTTIPRKSTLAASNGTLGTAQTLTVTRQSSSFTHTITYKCGSASGTVCTKSSSTSVSFTPPLSLASQNTTGTTVSVTFTITTYNGSTSIGSNTKTISCSMPASVKPSVSFTVSDAAGHLDTYGAYIQKQSKFSITLTDAGSYGSTIKSRKTTVDGKTYTSASITTGVISGSGTLKISVTVTDSRGRTATASENVTVSAYDVPKITALTVKRCDSSGNSNSSGAYLAIVFNSSVTALNNKNSAAYTVKYKKASETSYTTATLTDYANQYSVSGGVFIFAAETSSSYDVVFSVADNFKTTEKAAAGSSVKKVWSILKKGLGMAFGKVAEIEDTVEFAFETLFHQNTTYKNDKAIFGTTVDNSETYSALIPVTTSGNLALGYGLYKAGLGASNIYGNEVNFYTKNGIFTNGNDLYMNNNKHIYGTNVDGTVIEAFNPINSSGNTVIGYGNYDKKSGLTNLYGHDLTFGVSNIASPGTFRPYRRQGDSYSITFRTAGYVTNSGKDVCFIIPFAVPIIGSPNVTITSGDGFVLRQGDKYTHGSSASTPIAPASYSATVNALIGVAVVASFTSTTNVTNNDAIGIWWNGTITFS